MKLTSLMVLLWEQQQELVELCAKGNRELIAKQKEIVGDILR